MIARVLFGVGCGLLAMSAIAFAYLAYCAGRALRGVWQ